MNKANPIIPNKKQAAEMGNVAYVQLTFRKNSAVCLHFLRMAEQFVYIFGSYLFTFRIRWTWVTCPKSGLVHKLWTKTISWRHLWIRPTILEQFEDLCCLTFLFRSWMRQFHSCWEIWMGIKLATEQKSSEELQSLQSLSTKHQSIWDDLQWCLGEKSIYKFK